MGLKSAGTDIHEVVGVRASKMKEAFYDDGIKAPPGMAGNAEPAGPKSKPGQAVVASGPTRISDVNNERIKLPNGQAVTYTGKLKQPANVPHGTGKAVYDHGVTYEGEWSVGKRHGPGKITKEKEGYYSSGECEDDLFIGTWTKKSISDDTFLEEQHYDHTTMDTMRRHLGFAGRKAQPKEESPTKEPASPAKN